MKRFLGAIIFFMLAFAQAQRTQSPPSKLLQGVFVQHDNDFLFAIDRYYTAGSFIEYSRQLPSALFLHRSPRYPIQLDIIFGQETYTPRELFNTNVDRLERPYAGYLFLATTLSTARERQLFSLKMELGLAGEQSKAGEFQIAYHKLIGEFLPVWSGQIANSSHINTYGSYIRDYPLPNAKLVKNFSLHSSVALGTRRVYARQEALLFVGNRADAGMTSAFQRLGTQQEFYGVGGVGVEFVALNALIEGHPFGDSSPFTLPARPAVFFFKLGGAYRGAHNLYKIIYNFRSKETAREGRSQFITFSLGRWF